ncbi:MAG TPA: type VI secretion system baseplate subunit TssF/IglH [Victivallales bacterium]|nr:type VI secretion system baseplate subunit TssF/IglH [Victivallales bacterium]
MKTNNNYIQNYENELFTSLNNELIAIYNEDRNNSEHDFFKKKYDVSLSKILCRYLSNNKTDIKTYFLNYQKIKLNSLFPFYFNDIPNCLMLDVKFKNSNFASLQIEIDEYINIYSRLLDSTEYGNFSFRSLLSLNILPFNLHQCKYDYDISCLKIDFTGNEFFNIPKNGFHFFISYNKEINSTLFLYDLLKDQTSAYLDIKYIDGRKKRIKTKLNWGMDFDTLPKNLNLKLKLTYPELFMYCYVEYSGNDNSDFENISSFALSIQSPLEIIKYNLNNIFHINLIPCINVYKSYAQSIKFYDERETYPIINQDDYDFTLFNILDVFSVIDEKKKKIRNIEYKIKHYEDINYPCYELEPAAYDLNQLVPQLKLYMPLECFGSTIQIEAEWFQLFLLSIEDSIVSFKDRSKGLFTMDIFNYFPAKLKNVQQIEIKIAKAWKILAIKNEHILTTEDLFFLADFLGDHTKLFDSIRPLIKDIIIYKKKRTKFIKIIFKYQNNFIKAACTWFSWVLSDFILSNSSMDSDIKILTDFKEV